MIKTSTKICLALATVMLLVSLESAKAQGNLVVNGTFDADASGWTLINILPPGGYMYNGFFAIWGNPSDQPAISQTIYGLEIGTTYTVSGDYALAKGNNPINGFGVAIDGNNLFTGSAPMSGLWVPFDFSFTAASTSVDLTLNAYLNGSNSSFFVDNISMVAVVPEPSSLCLLGLGAAGGLFFRHRKKKIGRRGNL